MSDVILKPSVNSWHTRRFYESAGKTERTNLCHYFWVVMKSLVVSLASAATVRTVSRALVKIGFWALVSVLVFAASLFFIVGVLVVLTLLGAWVLALIALMSGSEITPQNTIPFLMLLQQNDAVDPLGHSDALFFVYMSIAIDLLLVLALSMWGVTKYNATHTAGFIRLSWERFKVWKDGTVVCPIIEFEESQ